MKNYLKSSLVIQTVDFNDINFHFLKIQHTRYHQKFAISWFLIYTVEAGGASGGKNMLCVSGIVYRQQNGSIHFVTRYYFFSFFNFLK